MLQVIIDSEAKRFYGMIIIVYFCCHDCCLDRAYVGQASGGIGGISGGFPLFDVDKVSDTGSQVVFHHLQDPRDTNVRNEYAEKGLRAAQATGAIGYSEIT